MTPEDKELMVRAARNAGYDIWWKTGICKGGPYESAFIGDTPWRPLDDDGDAFRLLLKTAEKTPFDAYFGMTIFCLDSDRSLNQGVRIVEEQYTVGGVRRAVVAFAAKGDPDED